MADTTVNNLVINTLTGRQYSAEAERSTSELWFITDDSIAKTPNVMPVLAASAWVSNTQTVTVVGITKESELFIAPDSSSMTAYNTAGIQYTGKAQNTLTFTCQTVPSVDITVNVVMLNSESVGINPTGTLTVTSNNTYDVTEYESLAVNLPFPSATLNVTANGNYDITNYGNVNINTSASNLLDVKFALDADNKLVYNPAQTSYNASPATEIGKYALQHGFYNDKNLTSVNLSTIEKVNERGLFYTFNGCTNLTGALDLSSLTEIGNYGMTYSFRETGITSVDLSNLNTLVLNNCLQGCFYKCTDLVSADLSSLTTLSTAYAMQNCFQDCTSLTTVDLSGITSINYHYVLAYCFDGCTSLTTLDLHNLTSIAGNAAAAYCCKGCTSLTTVDLGALATMEAGDNNIFLEAFKNCTALTSVDLHSLTSIGTVQGSFSSTFQHCTSLTSVGGTGSSVNLSGLTTLNGYTVFNSCFKDCTNLTLVDLSSLTTLSGDNAMQYCFQGCTALTTVDLSGITTLPSGSAMSQCFKNCTNLTTVDLSGIASILSNGMFACFEGCTNLTSVDLSSLISVSGQSGLNSCFSNCNHLVSLDLSNLTTLSGKYSMNACFYACTALTTVTLGSTTAIDFGSEKNQFISMFSNCTQNITLNIATDQATLSTFEGYDTSGNGHHFGCTGVVTINYTAVP